MLSLVSIPIGDPDDITIRALAVLKAAEVMLTEDYKVGDYWRRRSGSEAELIVYDEHTAKSLIPEILPLIKTKKCVLISDTGTPVFADPGQKLLQVVCTRSLEPMEQIAVIPGASSLMAALSLCPFPLPQFTFLGFPPRKTSERLAWLKKSQAIPFPIIIYDTPYRLQAVLEDISYIFPSQSLLWIGFELTAPQQKIYFTTLKHFTVFLKKNPANFKNHRWVLILAPNLS